MGNSEPLVSRREVSALATTAVLVAGALTTSPASAADPRVDPPTLRLNHEAGGVAAVDVPLSGRLVPVGPHQHRTARMGTSSFSMIGFTWPAGAATIRVRVRSDGDWGSWRTAERLPLTRDPVASGKRRARSATELIWVGESDGVQVQSAGVPPIGLEMTLIEPSRYVVPKSPAYKKADRHPRMRPNMHSRKAWGANEKWRDGSPRYNRTIQQVHVHHTVNGNGYSRSSVPGILRGIYRYHTKSLGWSDIGYNFLVDRFGRIWVGRAGGPHRPVRGAHTLGFNSTSTGVAVIGNFQSRRPQKKVQTAIVRLAAWKLHRHHRNPKGTVKVYSHGSDRYPPGRVVRLPTIDGHRDTNQTACPGIRLYKRLPVIRWRAWDRVRRLT